MAISITAAVCRAECPQCDHEMEYSPDNKQRIGDTILMMCPKCLTHFSNLFLGYDHPLQQHGDHFRYSSGVDFGYVNKFSTASPR